MLLVRIESSGGGNDRSDSFHGKLYLGVLMRSRRRAENNASCCPATQVLINDFSGVDAAAKTDNPTNAADDVIRNSRLANSKEKVS
jgi:hypothetical protein